VELKCLLHRVGPEARILIGGVSRAVTVRKVDAAGRPAINVAPHAVASEDLLRLMPLQVRTCPCEPHLVVGSTDLRRLGHVSCFMFHVSGTCFASLAIWPTTKSAGSRK
jgi:hypothetical protein